MNTSEDSPKLTLGGINRNGDSYLRIQEEESVYLIEDSLGTKWGRGIVSNFYFKKLVPENISSKELLAIELIRNDLKDTVFQKEGESWMMLSKGKIASPEVENLASRIIGFESNSVYLEEMEIPFAKTGILFELRYSFKNPDGQASQAYAKCIGKTKNNEYIIKTSLTDIFYKAEEYQVESFLNKKADDFITPQ